LTSCLSTLSLQSFYNSSRNVLESRIATSTDYFLISSERSETSLKRQGSISPKYQKCESHVPPFPGTYPSTALVEIVKCFNELTISSVSLWPFPGKWSYFLIYFDGIGYGLYDAGCLRCILFREAFWMPLKSSNLTQFGVHAFWMHSCLQILLKHASF
jgi:hypothetical protein